MTRGVKSYTDSHAKLFQLLGNRDRLAIYGCLHKQRGMSITELCDFMGWDSEDGSADVQAMRRHLKALRSWHLVDRYGDERLWLPVENTLKGRLGEAINALCR